MEITADWLIINFDILTAHANRLIAAKAGTIIVDEAHELRNRNSKRFSSALKIVYSCERRYLLTGTPIYNRPADMLALLQLLGKLNSDFGGFLEFVERYCSARDTPFGLDYSGASNLDELHDLLYKKKIMMRRKKAAVLALTEKHREVIRVTIDPTHLHSYEECEKDLAAAIIKNPELLELKRFDFLSHIRQAVGLCKIEAAAVWLEKFLASSNDGKIIVFAHHAAVRQELTRRFAGDVVALSADISAQERAKRVQEFQSGTKRIFLTSPRIGGTGLTLTAASTVLFVELDWTAAAMLRAEDRAYRIGQTRDVRVIYLFADDTIDGFILSLINRKTKIFNKTIKGLCDQTYLLRLAVKHKKRIAA